MPNRTYRRITYADRVRIETMYNRFGMNPLAIAKELGFCNSSIYREMRLGFYDHRDGSTWKTVRKYSADKAQQNSDYRATAKGTPLKIGKDRTFARTMEELIVERKLSPAAALAEIKRKKIKVATTVCVTTLYHYIDSGVFLHLSNKHLLMQGKRREQKKRSRPLRPPLRGTSIEQRPAEIQERATAGHWELDSVIGKQTRGETLLTFTERKTRYELIFRSKDKTATSVVNCLDRLEQSLGKKNFSRIFRTITCDNGCEFSDYRGMELSIDGNSRRTKVYFCHPYRSGERGSNENQNRIIRRFVKKGTPIRHYSDADLRETARYINQMPRKLLDWHTSEDLFISELSALGINFFDFFRKTS